MTKMELVKALSEYAENIEGKFSQEEMTRECGRSIGYDREAMARLIVGQRTYAKQSSNAAAYNECIDDLIRYMVQMGTFVVDRKDGTGEITKVYNQDRAERNDGLLLFAKLFINKSAIEEYCAFLIKGHGTSGEDLYHDGYCDALRDLLTWIDSDYARATPEELGANIDIQKLADFCWNTSNCSTCPFFVHFTENEEILETGCIFKQSSTSPSDWHTEFIAKAYAEMLNILQSEGGDHE